MGFCTKCGRQRTETGEFCSGCGAQFSDAADPSAADPSATDPTPAPETLAEPAPAAEATVEPVAPAQTSVESGPSDESPWAAPLADLPAIEPTRWDTNWYQQGPSPAGQGGYGYGPASYAQGSPGQSPAGQAPYGPPPYQPPPHVPGTIGTPPLRRGQTAILTILLVVVLLAVGGGAYVLVSHFTGHKLATPPSSNPTLSAPATQAAGTTTPASPSATATTSPTTSPTVSPSARVIVAADVTDNPAEPTVAGFLDRYFTAINSHDYAAYSSLLDSREQSVNTPASFNTGYGSTTDSAETLTGIAGTAGGGEAATVSFTSHQSAAESPTKTSCTSWTITLYLQPNGGSYLIGPAPAGYHASYRAC